MEIDVREGFQEKGTVTLMNVLFGPFISDKIKGPQNFSISNCWHTWSYLLSLFQWSDGSTTTKVPGLSGANDMCLAHDNGNSDLGQAPGDIWLHHHPVRSSTVLLLCSSWPSGTKCCSSCSKRRKWNADSLSTQKKLINVFYLQLQQVFKKS